jgi:hypothetical protein
MTEEEWRECSEPKKMLELCYGAKESDRKFRLFAVACCRRIWRLLPDERSRNGLLVTEMFVDNRATAMEFRDAGVASCHAYYDMKASRQESLRCAARAALGSHQ